MFEIKHFSEKVDRIILIYNEIHKNKERCVARTKIMDKILRISLRRLSLSSEDSLARGKAHRREKASRSFFFFFLFSIELRRSPLLTGPGDSKGSGKWLLA